MTVALATAALLMTTAIPALAQQASRDTSTMQTPDSGSQTQGQMSDAMVRKVGTRIAARGDDPPAICTARAVGDITGAAAETD